MKTKVCRREKPGLREVHPALHTKHKHPLENGAATVSHGASDTVLTGIFFFFGYLYNNQLEKIFRRVAFFLRQTSNDFGVKEQLSCKVYCQQLHEVGNTLSSSPADKLRNIARCYETLSRPKVSSRMWTPASLLMMELSAQNLGELRVLETHFMWSLDQKFPHFL